MSTPHDDLRRHPGHLIRRAQQVHYWLWNAEVSADVTSPQFAVLYALRAGKNIDQKTLGERVSLDRSTTAEVVARLASRGLLQRFRDPTTARPTPPPLPPLPLLPPQVPLPNSPTPNPPL